jgi:hypothetical protein
MPLRSPSVLQGPARLRLTVPSRRSPLRRLSHICHSAQDLGRHDSPYRQTGLSQIVATPGDNIVAVGAWTPGKATKPGRSQPLIVLWTGSVWQRLDTGPLVPRRQALICAVAFGGNGLLVGGVGGSGKSHGPFVDGLSGGRWTIADATALGLASSVWPGRSVVSLAASSDSDAWALIDGSFTQPDMNMPIFLHWNGQTWSVVQAAPYEAEQ